MTSQKYQLFLFSALLVLGFFFIFAGQALAGTIYANSSIGNDGTGDGSSEAPYKTFHKAYTTASSGDTLDLSGTFTWLDADETGDAATSGYTIAKNLTIQGQGAGETIIQAATKPTTAEMRIFTMSSVTVTIKDITLRYGHEISASGSCISATGGSLTILDSYIYQNNNPVDTEYNSVGTYMGDDRYNNGALSIGGTSFIARNTTFANNTNPYSAAITVGTTNTEITNCTFFGNVATYETLYITAGTAVLTNNTFYETDSFASGVVCLWSGTTYLKNNLIQGTSPLDCNNSGNAVDGGYNIVKSVDVCSITNGVNGNIVGDQGSNLKLSTSLSLNGATNGVPNLALQSDSVAIDAGDSAVHGPEGYTVTPPSTDQRGLARYNTTYDVGSVEYRGSTDIGPYLSSNSLASDNDYIDLTFSEGIYGDSGANTAVSPSDFGVTFNANGGGASAVSISSVTRATGNSALEGGETTIRLHLSITGTPNGVETIIIYPTTSSSIFDSDGNAVPKMDDTGEKTLSGYFEYYVDPTGTDDGDHGTASGTGAWATIQYAITNVPNPTTYPTRIHIAAGTYTTNNDDIDIDRDFTDLILQGANAATTIVQPHADPASATVGNFDIGTSENVTINDMTIRYGRVDSGSGINISTSGSLALNRVYVYDCDGTAAGGIVASSPVVIDSSTIANSDATGGSTFSRGGIYIGAANSIMTNSTLFDNRVNASQSSANGYITSSGRLTMINCTIVGGGTTGSYGNFMVDNGGQLYIKNTIFANKDQGSYDLYKGSSATITSCGYNIVETYSGFSPASTDLTGNQASLNIAASLDLNSTESGVPTLSLSEGSVAINAGNSSSCNGVSVPNTDQRSATRAGAVDMGAFEYGGVVSAPYATSFYPTDDATDIALNSNLMINFSEAVDAESGNIYLYKSDDTLVETFDVTSDISGSGTDTIIINPTSSFAGLTGYYVLIDATAFDDASSNSYAGISSSATWSFTSIDGTAPTITSVSSDKTNGSYTVGEVIDIDVTFSEAVTSTGNVTVTLETGDTDRTCTFTVSGSTTGTCNYTVQAGDTSSDLEATISGTIKDASNNVLTAFTPATGLAASKALVIDTTAPTATLSPLDNASDVTVSDDLVLTFSEAVDAESGNIVLYKRSDDSVVESFDVTADIDGSGTTTITIDPASDLSYETEYYVQIDATAFDDAAGNSYVGLADSTSWNFTTENTPLCDSVEHAATYNDWPTCGVASCASGYVLVNGACNSAGGGAVTTPPSLGTGSTDNAIPMNTTKTINNVMAAAGANVTMYINSTASFQARPSQAGAVQDHAIKVIDLNMLTGQVKLEISSEPQIIELSIGNLQNVDLDKDGVNDIELVYNQLFVNRVDLTVKQLAAPRSAEKSSLSQAIAGVGFGYYRSSSGGVGGDDQSPVMNTSNNSSAGRQSVNVPGYKFNVDLYLGITDPSVKDLQRYLNDHGYVLTTSGLGSPGQETNFFGQLTKQKLIEFQKANKIYPAWGYCGPVTRSLLK